MKWIIVLIFFNDGLHYAQTQPYFYKNYDVCEAAASEVKKVYSKNMPHEDAQVMAFCASLPRRL